MKNAHTDRDLEKSIERAEENPVKEVTPVENPGTDEAAERASETNESSEQPAEFIDQFIIMEDCY